MKNRNAAVIWTRSLPLIVFGLLSLTVFVYLAAILVPELFAAQKSATPAKPAPVSPVAVKYPALVDVGAKKCIPCKMMAPILDELTAEYAGRLRVEFIDVQIDPDTATKLGVRGIPTQIFYDASGKERHRHLGYISKEDILATFKKLGIELHKKDTGKKGK